MKYNIYNEAKRFFGSRNQQDNLDQLDFEESKFALVIDLRTLDEENVVNSGRMVMGSPSRSFTGDWERQPPWIY